MQQSVLICVVVQQNVKFHDRLVLNLKMPQNVYHTQTFSKNIQILLRTFQNL